MKNYYLLIFFSLFLVSCGSSKKTTARTYKSRVETKKITKSSNKDVLKDVLQNAEKYLGTRYKYGGTTRAGMDCSGLVFTAFKEENIEMPRVSRDMAKKGIPISLREATKGDLVFFQTNKNRKVINHVGIVTDIDGDDILFIHSTTSRGVIVSSMKERYWQSAFIEIRRII